MHGVRLAGPRRTHRFRGRTGDVAGRRQGLGRRRSRCGLSEGDGARRRSRDQSRGYGRGIRRRHSEQVMSRAIKNVGRDRVFIATKVGGWHLRADDVRKACAGSLKRLGVREIDLYQVHWPDPWSQVPLRETMKALEALHRAGRIRHIGVSNFAVRDLEEARSDLSKADIASNQVRYNMLQREVEAEVVPYCKR